MDEEEAGIHGWRGEDKESERGNRLPLEMLWRVEGGGKTKNCELKGTKEANVVYDQLPHLSSSFHPSFPPSSTASLQLWTTKTFF